MHDCNLKTIFLRIFLDMTKWAFEEIVVGDPKEHPLGNLRLFMEALKLEYVDLEKDRITIQLSNIHSVVVYKYICVIATCNCTDEPKLYTIALKNGETVADTLFDNLHVLVKNWLQLRTKTGAMLPPLTPIYRYGHGALRFTLDMHQPCCDLEWMDGQIRVCLEEAITTTPILEDKLSISARTGRPELMRNREPVDYRIYPPVGIGPCLKVPVDEIQRVNDEGAFLVREKFETKSEASMRSASPTSLTGSYYKIPFINEEAGKIDIQEAVDTNSAEKAETIQVELHPLQDKRHQMIPIELGLQALQTPDSDIGTAHSPVCEALPVADNPCIEEVLLPSTTKPNPLVIKYHKETEYHDDTDYQKETEYHDDTDYQKETEYHDDTDYQKETEYHDDTDYHKETEYHDDTDYQKETEYHDDTDYQKETEYHDDTHCQKETEYHDDTDYISEGN